MTSKEPRARQLIFADANVFIEALYLPDSAAAAVIQLAATSAIDLITCEPVTAMLKTPFWQSLRRFQPSLIQS